jgi:hypothetical protein
VRTLYSIIVWRAASLVWQGLARLGDLLSLVAREPEMRDRAEGFVGTIDEFGVPVLLDIDGAYFVVV